MGDLDPQLIHGSFSPQPKWHLDWFSRVCRAQDCHRQTDRPLWFDWSI